MERRKGRFYVAFFSENWFKKNKVATYEFTKPIQILLNASKVFKNSGTKKRSRMTSCPAWLP